MKSPHCRRASPESSRLGVIPAASSTVALLTDPFCAEHPLVRVQLESHQRSAGTVERLRRFELDAGIIYLDGRTPPACWSHPLYQERQVLIASSGVADEPSGSDHLGRTRCNYRCAC